MGIDGGSLVIGESALTLRGAGFGAMAGGAPGAGPVAGGGESGPTDCAASGWAQNRSKAGRSGLDLKKKAGRFNAYHLLESVRSISIVSALGWTCKVGVGLHVRAWLLQAESPRRIYAKIAGVGGAVAQLGARLDGIEEVEGSNPFGSTKIFPSHSASNQPRLA